MKLSANDKKLIQDFLERADKVHLRTTNGKKNWATRHYQRVVVRTNYGKTRSNSN